VLRDSIYPYSATCLFTLIELFNFITEEQTVRNRKGYITERINLFSTILGHYYEKEIIRRSDRMLE